jgi:hypothetical protein
MKNIKDLTEQDCIHCRTQEEFNAILMVHNPMDLSAHHWNWYKQESTINKEGKIGSRRMLKANNYTIHPASDFLTPQVNVLTEIGDCKVIKNGGDVIVMTGNVVITLTPPVLKHIQELLNQQQ